MVITPVITKVDPQYNKTRDWLFATMNSPIDPISIREYTSDFTLEDYESLFQMLSDKTIIQESIFPYNESSDTDWDDSSEEDGGSSDKWSSDSDSDLNISYTENISSDHVMLYMGDSPNFFSSFLIIEDCQIKNRDIQYKKLLERLKRSFEDKKLNIYLSYSQDEEKEEWEKKMEYNIEKIYDSLLRKLYLLGRKLNCRELELFHNQEMRNYIYPGSNINDRISREILIRLKKQFGCV